MKDTAAALLLVFAQGAFAQAQSQTAAGMKLCSADLTIGMTQQTLINSVAAACEVTKPAGKEAWTLKRKGTKGQVEGKVEFSDGKVSALGRSWAPAGGQLEGADFVRSLVSAVQSALQKDSAPGTVSYSVKREPGVTHYQIKLDLPDRRQVRVSLAENPNGQSSADTILDLEEWVVNK